ncbi:MAG: haloacid dehalogenase-like hydrolase [Puniceicoccales bacterium]|jgi:phosphoserine phosphatase|nr:haloacid dehalogenase-like hydrolase [Puniceicoccales bacterium]
MSNTAPLCSRHILACVWDFDKTLIPGYMQAPLFKAYGVNETAFWEEVNRLPELYARKGIHVSKDTVYLNHLLSYVKNGPLRGLSNKRLRELGAEINFFPGLPEFFGLLREHAAKVGESLKLEVVLEHYIISTGLAEMVRGSRIASHVEGVFGCEFIEQPLPPGYARQEELSLSDPGEISQIGVMVDNTIKTRFIFEINKGTNKNPGIDVNAVITATDRRIPFENMIYIADGPSDVPVFSLVRKNGGVAYAVYDETSEAEFRQSDQLQAAGRVHGYGPSDYRQDAFTPRWLRKHIEDMIQGIARGQEFARNTRLGTPPRHLRDDDETLARRHAPRTEQTSLF